MSQDGSASSRATAAPHSPAARAINGGKACRQRVKALASASAASRCHGTVPLLMQRMLSVADRPALSASAIEPRRLAAARRRACGGIGGGGSDSADEPPGGGGGGVAMQRTMQRSTRRSGTVERRTARRRRSWRCWSRSTATKMRPETAHEVRSCNAWVALEVWTAQDQRCQQR